MPRSAGVGSKGDALACTSQNSGNRDVLLGCSTPAFLSVQVSAGGSNPQEEKTGSSHLLISLSPC